MSIDLNKKGIYLGKMEPPTKYTFDIDEDDYEVTHLKEFHFFEREGTENRTLATVKVCWLISGSLQEPRVFKAQLHLEDFQFQTDDPAKIKLITKKLHKIN